MTRKIYPLILVLFSLSFLLGVVQPARAAVVAPKIAAGGYHTVALLSDGTVKAWGDNEIGQLGNGTTTNSSTPVTVTGLGGTVAAIAAGRYHTVALLSDGTVKAWGLNSSGQLGNGSTTNSSTPVTVTGLGGTVTAIAAGYNHTMALMSDGTVKAWGYNGYGQLGNGTTTNSSTPVTVTGLGGTVTAIAAGASHAVALMTDGTVKAWGYNYYGQLGNGTTTDSSTPVTVTGLGGTVTAIAANYYHTVALMSGGTVKSWGYNSYGQLGNGTYTNSSTPVTVTELGGTGTAIAAGQYHTVALLSDGTVRAWGYDYNGQLGDGVISTSSGRPVSVAGLGGTVTAIAAGGYYTVALLSDGTVKAWGDNFYGQLGNGTTGISSTPVTVTGLGGTCTTMAAGFSHTLTLLADGTVKAWGYNGNGQLGNGTTTNSSIPVAVTGLGGAGTAIAAGYYHTVALLSDGTVKAWGFNASGQLGNGTTTSSSTPITVTGLGGTGTAIAAGAEHTVALLSDGTVKAWGLNNYWQLGNGSTTNSSTPVTVTGLGGTVAAIAAGYGHTVALMTDGTVKAWGYNNYGQLGNGTTSNSSTPVTVTGLGGTVAAIATGDYYTVALMTDGSVKAWGWNNSGQLGNGSYTNSSTPVTVTGLGGTVTAIAAGASHTVALLSDGTVKAWGRNFSGQLGNGTTTDSSTPVTVMSLGGTVTAIAAGDNHTVARLTDGTVKAWGNNAYGQLGNGKSNINPTAALINLDVTTPSTGNDLPAGSYSGSQTLHLSCSDNYSGCAGTWYTTDGSDPTYPPTGTTQTYGSYLTISDTTTLKYFSRDLAENSEPIQGRSYTITTAAYPLTVAISGSGTVGGTTTGTPSTLSYTSSGSSSISANAVVTLTATPGSGYGFSSWSGCDTASGNQCTVTMTGTKYVTASFTTASVSPKIAAGGYHTVALLADGTVKAWGDNFYGQLGNGTTTNSITPVTVTGLGGTVIAIAAGDSHTAALMSDGTVKAWGYNLYGQLGNGTTTNSSTPVTVTGLGGTVTAIAAGHLHAVALMANGTVKTWGLNNYGQLGNGTTTNSSTPVTVTGLGGTVTAIAAGGYHTVALMADGTVKVWGYNGNGELGNGTFTSSSTPVTVTGLGGTVTAITAGYDHTVALLVNGTVKTWGWNNSGQLGNGTTTNSSTPVTVTGLGGAVTAIAAGYAHTVALMADATVKAWGGNTGGQLGNGTTTSSNTPVTVMGLGGTVTAIAAGTYHTVALMSDGSVKAWGDNGNGQLGNGTAADSSSPVQTVGSGGSGTLNAATGVTVKAATSYFGTIGAGYTVLSSGDTLMLQAMGYFEPLLLNRAIAFTFKGGYDAGFSSQVGSSTIYGSITIASGTVTFDGIAIQ